MTKPDLPVVGALAVLGVFIWTRDLAWGDAAGDTLPLLAALPLFFWLRRPWVRRPSGSIPLLPGGALAAAILFGVGVAADSGLLLAFAWTTLLWSWMAGGFVESEGGSSLKLLLLPLLAFPWLQTDLAAVAWWFRLSGAAATEQALAWWNVPVEREGTMLWCNGLGVSVEAACSGVNGLQSMLVAGGALAFVKLGNSSWYWWNLPLLVGAAWLANALRILSAALCGVFLEPATAAAWVGPVHDVAGWLALCVVFLLCYAVFALQQREIERRRRAGRGRMDAGVPVRLLVLAYAAFCSRGLVESWRWTPFDRLAWLAFVLWLLPVWWSTRQPGAVKGYSACCFVAVGLLLLGAAADINAFHHAGLACAFAAFHRLGGRWVWFAGAVAWMPIAGWFGSRLGLTPEQFGTARLLVAGLAVAWTVGFELWRRGRPGAAEVIWGGKARVARGGIAP